MVWGLFQWSAWVGWVSGRCWLSDPPAVRASICMPRQMARTGVSGLLLSWAMRLVSNAWRAGRTGVISGWDGVLKDSVIGSSPPERMNASKRLMRDWRVDGSEGVGGRMTGMPPALWTAWA